MPAPPARPEISQSVTSPTPSSSEEVQTVAKLETKRLALQTELRSKTGDDASIPEEVIKTHIQKLARYNEMRDVAEGLLALIAEERGCRIGEVMEEFGCE